VTPSRWTLFAPVWARWLVGAIATGGTFAAITMLTVPTFRSPTDWPGKVAVIAGSGAAFASLMIYAEQPWRRLHLAALHGLDSHQRRLALAALRRGDAPTDPAALAGAIRVGALSMSFRRRSRKSQRRQWWLPGLYVALAILDLLTHKPRHGLLWLGFALFFAAYFQALAWRGRRLQRQVELLRTAAAGIPDSEAVIAEAADGVPALPRRIWLMVMMLVIIGVCFVATEYFWGSWTPQPLNVRERDCATVRQVVEFLNSHQEMLDAQRIAPGGPVLGVYQQWSDQLDTFARQVGQSDLSPHLTRIADLAVDAVAVVRDVRENANVATKPASVMGYEDQYTRIMSDLIMQSGQATSTCTRH